MKVTFEASSNIVSAELHETSGRCSVTFRTGIVITYAQFTPELLQSWADAPNVGAWYQRHILAPLPRNRKPVAPCDACGVTPRRGAHLTTGLCESCGQNPVTSTEVSAVCTHTTLRELAGGTCPVCEPNELVTNSETRSDELVTNSEIGSDELVTKSEIQSDQLVTNSEIPPDQLVTNSGIPSSDLVTNSEIQSDDLVTKSESRPEQLATNSAQTQKLRKLTRVEAMRLIERLAARRMRNNFAEFIKGAWHVLEGSTPLEWNFHHDALCYHAQIMVEEWHLSGFKSSGSVEKKIRKWEHAGRPTVKSIREYWESLPGRIRLFERKYKQRAQELAVNVGPISLKSRIFGVFLPAWAWLEIPNWQVLCASATTAVWTRDSLACRDLVQSDWYRNTFDVPWHIRDDLNRTDKWANTSGGMRDARGTSANVTGVHADCLIVDDPDDATQVWSTSERNKVMLFWLGVGNRLNDLQRPLRFVVQQNLHEEDLSSRVIANGMPRLAIPVEFDPAKRDQLYTAPYGWRDPRTELGELIHPIRFSTDVLNAERKRLGTQGFEAQYNCNPSPLEGGMIKRDWFRFFRIQDVTPSDGLRERPTGCRSRTQDPAVVLGYKTVPGRKRGPLDLDWLSVSVDASFGSTKDSASAVAVLVVGGRGNQRFVFEAFAKPMGYPETRDYLEQVLTRWDAKRVIIEAKANGMAVTQDLELKLASGEILGPAGKPAIAVLETVNPEGGKESRAAAMVPAIEAGMVYLLDGAAWLEPFVGELCTFPNAKRDDQVDALSQVMTYYRDDNGLGAWGPWVRKKNLAM